MRSWGFVEWSYFLAPLLQSMYIWYSVCSGRKRNVMELIRYGMPCKVNPLLTPTIALLISVAETPLCQYLCNTLISLSLTKSLTITNNSCSSNLPMTPRLRRRRRIVRVHIIRTLLSPLHDSIHTSRTLHQPIVGALRTHAIDFRKVGRTCRTIDFPSPPALGVGFGLGNYARVAVFGLTAGAAEVGLKGHR